MLRCQVTCSPDCYQSEEESGSPGPGKIILRSLALSGEESELHLRKDVGTYGPQSPMAFDQKVIQSISDLLAVVAEHFGARKFRKTSVGWSVG